jgi:hypothetical protein
VEVHEDVAAQQLVELVLARAVAGDELRSAVTS